MAVATSTTNGHEEVGKPRLKRSMGLWMATALVVGNMVGSGICTPAHGRAVLLRPARVR